MDPHTAEATGAPDPAETVVLRPHGLQGLLATVPYLLGFHPRESLVAVLFEDRRVVLTLRLDSDDLVAHPPDVEDFLLTQLRRLEATGVLLVAYTDEEAQDVAAALTAVCLGLEVVGLLDPDGAEVLDAVHVAAGRYRSLTCDDTTCCPPEGRDYANVLSDAAAADAVVHGLPAWSDREDLRRSVLPSGSGPDARSEAFDQALVRALMQAGTLGPRDVAEAMDRLLTRIETTGTDPDPTTLGHLVALAGLSDARDVATLRIERESAALWSRVWSAAARLSTGLAAVAPLGLVGVSAWARGTEHWCASASRRRRSSAGNTVWSTCCAPSWSTGSTPMSGTGCGARAWSATVLSARRRPLSRRKGENGRWARIAGCLRT
ncbi:DUF4192 domain-containing protein [Raineyella fluvialis]|uniref:DUF4192 family protein n=1 Tax=Raineyella fluvialis TaxID=2662261 RepID=A0A5Q2FBP7_9ACTN|nr:DUF4192 domain-containing protein [Raineyella fluvialis]QGF24312.1 DUF4192 family protein [Raineyella fluvialis]